MVLQPGDGRYPHTNADYHPHADGDRDANPVIILVIAGKPAVMRNHCGMINGSNENPVFSGFTNPPYVYLANLVFDTEERMGKGWPRAGMVTRPYRRY
jgi:hypothetical protein